uniref:Uncharacterized protein n=1 Tax=Arundo donax TaxID=35708 RepID=A0A0A9BC53_ARUDO
MHSSATVCSGSGGMVVRSRSRRGRGHAAERAWSSRRFLHVHQQRCSRIQSTARTLGPVPLAAASAVRYARRPTLPRREAAAAVSVPTTRGSTR